MKITKFEHACLVLEQGGQKLVIDPGVYTRPMTGFNDVQALVITHQHDDHCNEEQISRLLRANPNLEIFSTDDVRARLAKSMPAVKVTSVHHGDWYSVGEFTLEFFGDLHQEIHRSIPLVQNCGVMVNDRLYYPGDSYTQPDRAVEILACPTSAPWLKIGDVIDFVAAIQPSQCFATHNVHLSEPGHDLNNGRVQQVTEDHGGQFEYLLPGQTREF